MVANLLETVSGWLRGRWLAVGVTLILAYFGYHALHGRYGFLAWIDTSRDLEAGAAGAGHAVRPSARGWSATSPPSSPIRSTATCSRSSCG